MKCSFNNRILGISLFKMVLIMISSNQIILAQKSIDLSNVKFEIICNDTVGVNENAYIGYVLDYQDQFNPDSLELITQDFENDCSRLLYAAKTSTSTNVSTINGKTTTTHQVKWNAVIKTEKEGKFLTPGIILLCNNDTIDISPKSKVVVIKERTNPSDLSKLKPDNEIIRLVTVLDKESINLGDSVLMQVKLQSNQSFWEVRNDNLVEIDDCFYENKNMFFGEPIQITVDGVECLEWIVTEYILTPLKSGVIKIPEFKLKGNYKVEIARPDAFWGTLSSYQDVPFQTQSKEIKLKVK